MEGSLNRFDSMCVRRVCALVGAAVIAVSAVPQYAGAQVTQRWNAREFQSGVFGPDNAVDVAYWEDGTGVEWVYMTGYQTLANGATVFATHKYLANDPGPIATFDKRALWPLPATNPTGTNRAVAMEVDEDGNVYVTGESSDPNGADGLDYVIIKYDKNLVPHTDWTNAGHQDAVVRWDNPTVAGAASHDRPVDIALGKSFSGGHQEGNVVGITGTSYGGAAQDDIVTMLLYAENGNAYSGQDIGWNDVGWDAGVRAFNGGINNNDSPVAIEIVWIVPGSDGAALPSAFIAGTTLYPQPRGNDIVTMRYDDRGNRTSGNGWTNEHNEGNKHNEGNEYNSPMNGPANSPANGDDVATGMDDLLR